jgi:hypothetical protein
MEKVGLVTLSVTPMLAHNDFIKVVFPAPISPRKIKMRELPANEIISDAMEGSWDGDEAVRSTELIIFR